MNARLHNAAHAAPPRVMLVDDDPLARALLAAVLRHCGAQVVHEAADGPSALAMLSKGLPCDLLISDLKMSEMNGLELMSTLGSGAVPYSALSSAVEPALLDAAASALRSQGVPLLGCIDKPVTFDKVKALLARMNEDIEVPRSAQACHAWQLDELEHAVHSERFVPWFQPKFDLLSRMPVGLEILARWDHPDLGILSPFHFIDALDDCGLLAEVTLSLFAQALRGVRERAQWFGGYDLALNLSARCLDDPALPDQLLRLVKLHGVEPHEVTFELTETAVARHPERLQKALAHLRLHGFRIAIDDFGTGYASLAQLCALPFTELKIDRSFVASLGTMHKAQPVLETMLHLSHKLQLHVVAEGIETEEECRLLQSLGCFTGQGFLHSRPMDETALGAWIRSRH